MLNEGSTEDKKSEIFSFRASKTVHADFTLFPRPTRKHLVRMIYRLDQLFLVVVGYE